MWVFLRHFNVNGCKSPEKEIFDALIVPTSHSVMLVQSISIILTSHSTARLLSRTTYASLYVMRRGTAEWRCCVMQE
ncbi:hypothetical protein Y032_0069g395 [Ancylostoma ceylanicum]|uniref:Uncharacterized protein n=1 Tax=Ancylostoma ceylanicum TaxID=53326 RepID=A0A016TXK3_9BILA|nr:hypothetical protein Y032_0069g395 [Ancylostoma ceylanicum]